MADKREEIRGYGCMMLPGDLRRVHDPHEERVVVARGPLRRLLAKIVVARRA